jgi:hypothetical protein
MTRERFFDWEERLAIHIDNCNENTYQLGVWDCALFAADCIKAMTGDDVASDFREKYSDDETMNTVIKESAKGLITLLSKIVGKPCSTYLARRGDIVMDDAGVIGVCVGSMFYSVSESGGLISMSMQHAVRAWRV